MLKESLKAPLFTDGFRLIDLLCQSYPPHVWFLISPIGSGKIWPWATERETCYVHGGAAGEQGAGDGKSDEDVRIIGQQSAQHHKEDGKRAAECVNDAAAAKKAKTSTLSTDQQSFVSKFNLFFFVLSLCCSTGVAAQQVFAPEHSGVSLLCKG